MVASGGVLRYTHTSTPLDDSTRPLDNSTISTHHNPQRAGALVTSIILDGGATRAGPGRYPQYTRGRRLWVAQQAPHQKSPNGSVNTAQSQHGSGARNVPQPASQPQGQHSVSRWSVADVLDVSNEERNDDVSSTVPSETPWQCKPEFSTDKMVGDKKILTARCRWSGAVSVPAECQISDGCVGSLCGTHAACGNKATSKVVVLRTTLVSVTAVSG